MPQSWSPPPSSGVSRRQGISRSQLLSTWSPVWIYMLAGRAPHKSKLVVWALSGPGRANRHWAAWAGTGPCRANPSSEPWCQFYRSGHRGHNRVSPVTRAETSATSWGSSQPSDRHHQLLISQWHPDPRRLLRVSGDGYIKRWDPLTAMIICPRRKTEIKYCGRHLIPSCCCRANNNVFLLPNCRM